MSVQFGRWNFEGKPLTPDYTEKVSATLAPYGPDSNEAYSQGGVKILYRAFHTTKESRSETQPHICPSDEVITWDGRLDNRAELVGELRAPLTVSSTDVAIVAAAYEKWGANCFAKLIGDWALSIWNPVNRTLLLAKDPLGTKHLYYSFDNNQVTWSTILDPLVLFTGKTFAICEEYIAGWFAHVPAPHLTPFVGIHAVPPSSSVLLRPGTHNVIKYWDFNPGKRIRYRKDAEYEEHFRAVFAKAVQRSLRSDRPVLAELSGGMDSSSIVCMADMIIARGDAQTHRLDTISWYDSSNPNWDDPFYFDIVEKKRGRTGCHIDLNGDEESVANGGSADNSFLSEFDGNRLALTPVSWRRLVSKLFRQAAHYMQSEGHRVTLSGIGGEQPTGGGMPTPTPELQDLLARAHFFTFARQLKAWAIKMRKPRLQVLGEALRGFFPLTLVGLPEYIRQPGPWFDSGFIRRNHDALCSYSSRIKVFGSLPSFQEHIFVLDCERRFMASYALTPELLHEVRYPFHDRDLREFAYAIPREQSVGVGQRRSLMRRALAGIVPEALLKRKQKSFARSGTKSDDSTAWSAPFELEQPMVASTLRIIDANRLWAALQKARRKEQVSTDSLKRTFFLESWLRHLAIHGVLTTSAYTKPTTHLLNSDHNERSLVSLQLKRRQATPQSKSSAS